MKKLFDQQLNFEAWKIAKWYLKQTTESRQEKSTMARKHFREMLYAFESEVTVAITGQLERIGRRVSVGELGCSPFASQVSSTVDMIRINEQGQVVMDTLFGDLEELALADAISDNTVDHWELITLLEMLSKIDTKAKEWS